MRWPQYALSAVLFALAPGLAHAESIDPAAARELLKQGYELKTAGKYSEALEHLVESLRLDSQVKTMLNIADCEEQLGQLVEAQKTWILARDQSELQGAEPLRAEATKRLAALEQRMPRLTLMLSADAPAGTELRRDGVLLGRVSLGVALPTNPGKHQVTVDAAGHVASSYDVELLEKDSKTLEVAPGALLDAASGAPSAAVVVSAPMPAPVPASGQTSQPASRAHGAKQRIFGWGAVGVGAVSVGLGALFEAERASKLSDRAAVCPSRENCAVGSQSRINGFTTDARAAGTRSAVAFLTGGVFLASGVTLLLTVPKATTPSIAIAPLIDQGFRGALLSAHVW